MHKHGHGRGLDRISARHLQAVVDGLTDGSSSARRACGRGGRKRMLRCEGSGVSMSMRMRKRKRKRKPVEMAMAMAMAMEEDGASRVTDGEEYRSAVTVRQMLERHVVPADASPSTTDAPRRESLHFV